MTQQTLEMNEPAFETTRELATVQPPDPVTAFLAMVDRALDNNLSVEICERLLAVHRQLISDSAAQGFAAAVAEFQRRCPVIRKERTASYPTKAGGRVEYQFASYDDIMVVAQPILSDTGLVTTFSIKHTDTGMMLGTMRIRKGIHFGDVTLTVPIPSNVQVNDTQKYGIACSYLKRYLFCAGLNVIVAAEDEDANIPPDFIDGNAIADLSDLLIRTDTKLDKFLAWAGAESLDKFPVRKLKDALAFFDAKLKKLPQ